MKEIISPQAVSQREAKKSGLCITCYKPSDYGVNCEECAKKKREAMRNRRGFNEWVPGGKGRPPINANK